MQFKYKINVQVVPQRSVSSYQIIFMITSSHLITGNPAGDTVRLVVDSWASYRLSTTTMKLQRLLPLAILATTSVLAAPPSFFDGAQQAVLGSAEAKFKGVANQYLSDAKQAILKGKKELETWYHDGKEFIKQNNLLCEWVMPCVGNSVIHIGR